MLNKLAAIANFADQNGQHDVADDATQLIKSAQLWDALRTLFDPEHTPGVDRDTPFWKRLSKGWSRGKMDRNLGLVLAIMAERTKLNKKIDKMTEPVKQFQQEVEKFYTKLRSGDIKSDSLKDETRELQKGLKETLALISKKDLKNILKFRERLEQQQLKAAEKIKGLDEETKENLIAVLQGQSLPGQAGAGAGSPAQQAVPGQMPPPGDQATPDQQRIRAWLKTLPMPKMDYDEGLTSTRARGLAWTIFTRWGKSPMAMKAFFDQHPDKQEEGGYMFGKPFRKVFMDINDVMKLEKEHGVKPAAEQEKAKEEAPRQAPDMTDKNQEAPKAAPQSATPGVTEEEPAAYKAMREAEERKEAERIRAAQERARKEKAAPAPAASLVNDVSDKMVSTTAARLGREITRFGRVQQLRKLAALPIEELWGGPNTNWALKDPDDPGPDMYEAFPEGQERFDEGKDYDSAQTRLDAYEALQSKDEYPTKAEEILDLEVKFNRLSRQIKLMELSDNVPQEELEKLHEERRNIGNLLEHVQENRY